MRASLFSLDTRNCVCMLSLNIDLPDHIPKVDARVLMYLAWGRGTFSNVLLIIMKDVEYEAKFEDVPYFESPPLRQSASPPLRPAGLPYLSHQSSSGLL